MIGSSIFQLRLWSRSWLNETSFARTIQEPQSKVFCETTFKKHRLV